MRRTYPFLVALALLAGVPLFAQDDATRYLEEAGGAALLYRGHKAFAYPMAFNGTYFWDSPSYVEGAVIYNGIPYEGLSLNIDAARQDLLVKTPSGNAEKVLTREYVERFRMGGRLFLNLRNCYGPAAPEGYWEVLHDGRAKVVKQVVRLYQQDLNGNLRAEMGYDDPNYRSNVYYVFTYQSRTCYIAEDGTITPIRRRSQLLNFYKDRKRDINRHISSLENAGTLDLEHFCKAVVQYAESR
jgi:hypothetical protein